MGGATGTEGTQSRPRVQQREGAAIRAAPLVPACPRAQIGTKAHPIVGNIPAQNGLEGWGRLVQRFDPASGHANYNIMSNLLKHPKGNIVNMSFFIDKSEELQRRQDERTGRQAVGDDTKTAIMMDMCRVGLERRLAFNFNRHDTSPTVQRAISNYVEQMRHKSDPVECTREGAGKNATRTAWQEEPDHFPCERKGTRTRIAAKTWETDEA